MSETRSIAIKGPSGPQDARDCKRCKNLDLEHSLALHGWEAVSTVYAEGSPEYQRTRARLERSFAARCAKHGT